MLFALGFLGLCRSAASVALTHGAARAADFMVVAGMSAPSEMCLISTAGLARLEDCAAAIARRDGSEQWRFQAGGQLFHPASGTCATGGGRGAPVALGDCGSAGAWSVEGNGLWRHRSLCLSQKGGVARRENAAAVAAAAASSSMNPAAHGAWAAVDDDPASSWVSKMNEKGPVSLTLHLGRPRPVDSLRIVWDYPAKAFSVACADAHGQWAEVFATSVNTLRSTSIPLGGLAAATVRITMTEPHPLLGAFQGHTVYGISSVFVAAPGTQAVLDDCPTAASSRDARDKYFAVAAAATGADAALRSPDDSKAPLLAAQAALSSHLGELAKLAASGCVNVTSLQGMRARPLPTLPTHTLTPEAAEASDLLRMAKTLVVGVRSELM
mmetsp:Transcript_21445/g.60418  ORF Transcript_21445/g.60418 Transcript_21445/m.60418 type:complete len:383 (-) Transcript_21445:126-1274(-)